MDPSVAKQIEEDEMIPPMDNNVKPTTAVKTVRKLSRKRCPRGKRRNTKTKRCNKKCEPGYNRSKTSRRCLKNKKTKSA